MSIDRKFVLELIKAQEHFSRRREIGFSTRADYRFPSYSQAGRGTDRISWALGSSGQGG